MASAPTDAEAAAPMTGVALAFAADATPALLAAETRIPAVDGKTNSVSVTSSFRDVLSRCVFEMRVLNSRSNPRIDLPYSSYSMFKDLAFSVVYRLDEKNSVGLEYGREAFGQAFFSTDRIDEPLVDMVTRQDFVSASQWTGALYHRNAVLDWIGATWQHALPRTRLFSAIYPYSRAFLGATRQGPLAKARLGVNIAPTDISLFSLGVEGTMLRYRYEGVWYTTTKLGVTCGIAVGF
jgi:hypothetical protein